MIRYRSFRPDPSRSDKLELGSEFMHSMRADAPLQVDMDVLLAREAQQFLDAFFASDARLLVAAERRTEEVLRYLVDPHEAHLDAPPSLLVRADKVIE